MPAEWSALGALTQLNLQGNALSGPLGPPALSALTSLKQLNLGYNQITSTIPTVWRAGMTALTKLILTGNSLMCGGLPGSWATGSTVMFTGTGLNATCPSPPPSPPAPPSPPPSPASSLLSLKNEPASWPQVGLTGWDVSSTGPCVAPTWTGVTCSGGNVVGVELSYLDLQVSAHRAWGPGLGSVGAWGPDLEF